MNQFCDKCGSQINQTTGTCPNCAPNQVTNSEAKTKAKKPMNKKAMIIGAVAIVVAFSIVLGIGGILGYVIGKGEAKLPDSYKEIVEKYKLVMAGEEVSGSTLSNKLIDKFKNLENYEICYSLTDINDDDVDELIVGGRFEDDKNAETYDIYTMDSSGKAEQVFDVNSFNENTEIEIYNEVIKVTEEEDDYLHFTYNVLPEKSCIVEVDEEYYKDDDKYFEVIHNETTADEENEISEETFEEADDKYEGEELDLEWIKVVLEEDKKDKDTEPKSGAYIDIKNRRSEKADSGYGFVKYNVVEIPQIYGEENEEITKINNEINNDFNEFYDKALKKHSSYNTSSDLYYDFYALPTSTDRYLNLVYECHPVEVKFNRFSDTSYAVFSQVYDKETGKELTLEEAYQMAGTSEQEIKSDVKVLVLDDDVQIEEYLISSIGFRMLEDGTPQFLINAYIYSDYWGTEMCLYTWTNGAVDGRGIDYNEIEGEYSFGKLYLQKVAEYQKNINKVDEERKNKTATLVLEQIHPDVMDSEYYTRVVLMSDKKTFGLVVNCYEGFMYYFGDYTILSDGTINCIVTDDREISTEDITEITLTPTTGSKYKINLKDGEDQGTLQDQDIFVNNYN